MKTLRLAIATSMAAAFVAFAQTPAQAYPVSSCSIGVSDSTPSDGEDFTVTVTSTPSESDTDFTAEYDEQSDSGDGTSFTTEFEAVDGEELIEATATRDGVTVRCSTTVNVDEDGDDDGDGGDGEGDNGGLLPNTGGERLAWLIIGAMLVLVGGGVYMASRQRDA
jgi:LPXTG-motif cell wall-anchored protein